MPEATIPTSRTRSTASSVASAQQPNLESSSAWQADRRLQVVLFATALLLYLPGIWWGLPHATSAERVLPWGSDELGPLQPLTELYATFLAANPRFNPQYPLFHYVVQAVFCGPYLAFLWLTGGFSRPTSAYPFGFVDPVSSFATLTILSRIPSLLMGAAIPVLAYRTARVIWDRGTGLIAALVVLPMYALVYYSRTSNVDVPALFWIAVGFLLISRSWRDRFTTRAAIAIGVVAALATATKDASAFAFITAGLALVFVHLWRGRGRGPGWRALLPPIAAALASGAIVYLFASGLIFNLSRFARHLEWIRGSTAAMVYPETPSGYLALLRESVMHTSASLGLPTMICALVGLVLCARRGGLGLWLLLPALAILLATIVPIHFVNLRYVLVIAYVFALFAAYALALAFRRSRRAAIALTAVVTAWSLLRAVDLTAQMIADSRYEVGRWLRANVQPGERVAYFAASQKLPPAPASVTYLHADALCTQEAWHRTRPEFVLVIPQQHFELVHEWTVRAQLYDALEDGSLGYVSLGRVQAPRLSQLRAVPFVNPPVELFVRADRRASLAEPDLPQRQTPALFERAERRAGVKPRIPAGLVRNQDERVRAPCEGVDW